MTDELQTAYKNYIAALEEWRDIAIRIIDQQEQQLS
jgi:hypothetical protein